jgi:hypothetical protein
MTPGAWIDVTDSGETGLPRIVQGFRGGIRVSIVPSTSRHASEVELSVLGEDGLPLGPSVWCGVPAGVELLQALVMAYNAKDSSEVYDTWSKDKTLNQFKTDWPY